MTAENSILNTMVRTKMAAVRQLLWKPLIRQTHHPRRTQEKLLMNILKLNQNTVFGREHEFGDFKSYADFKQQVPVQSYEDLRPYIERQDREQKPYLNNAQPIMYAQTSGTTGKPKYVPILQSTVKQYRKSQQIFTIAEYDNIPGVFDGKVLAIVSPAIEGELESGTPYGSMSGLLYQSMPKFMHAKYVVPPEIFEKPDYDLKYNLIAAFAMAEKGITLIATANPSTLLKLHNVIQNHFDRLVNEIERGNPHGLEANPTRAQELRDLKANGKTITFSNLWPDLKSVTLWTQGNCSILIPAVKKLLHLSTKIVEMGYLSSEFRGSVTIDVLRNKSIPTIYENFFEFVPQDEWENETPSFLTIDELQQGARYYVIVTTGNGLYRYFINDIIEVDGSFNNTPTIRFIQKGKGVTNLTGEKLYEGQLIEAIHQLKQKLDVDFEFFLMIACPKNLRYSLYLEADPFEGAGRLLEQYLCQLNMEFESKRGSGRLQETSIVFLKKGAAEAYKRFCIDGGQREGQFKLMTLQYEKDCGFDFSPYLRAQYEDH